MKTLLLSTVAALALGGVGNATDFACGPAQFAVGKPSVDPQDTVNRIEVRHSSNSPEWMVYHRFVNGRVVARQEQYTLVDTSRNGSWSWRGQLRINGAITMVGELIRDQSGLYYVETQRDRGLVTMLARSACNQVAALTPTPDVVPAPTPTPAPAPLSPAEKKRQAAQAQNEAAKALAEAARLEAETARIKIEAEAEAIRRKEELAAKLERDKAEQAAKLERDKAEHDARLARERAEWEDKLSILLGSKTEFERIAIPLKIRGNSMRLNVGLGDQVLTMLLDTGATSSLITNALASSLIKDEHARYIGMTEFKTASGEIVKAKEIIINEVKIGDQVVRDVRASVVPGDVELLLGLNVLNKFGLYAIDSRNSQLIFTAKKEKAVAVKEEG